MMAVLASLNSQAFSEAPELAAKVASGDLAPVQRRLPDAPEVVQAREKNGRYGGTLRTALLATGDENGVLRFIAQGMTRWDEKFDRILPNIAAGWTVNADATEYVFQLRRGMRWSDGAPFTADDVVFAVNDVIGVREVFGAPADRYQAAGQIMRAEKIDPWQVRIRFAAGNRMLPEELAGPYGHHPVIYPKHYCAQFHAAHNPQADAEARAAGFTGWVARFNRECPAWGERWSTVAKPTLDPWLVSEPMGRGLAAVVVRRNPYFWQVDQAGRQLPYLDAIQFNLYKDAAAIQAVAVAGDLDLQIRHVSGVALRAQLAPLVAQGRHVMLRLPDVNASAVGLYLNHTTPNEALRMLFADVRFKAALSQAIDREAIAKTVFLGEVTPWQVGPPAGHRFYNQKLAAQHTQFDLAAANRALDALGLAQRDSEGYRLLPDGKRLSLRAIVNNYSNQMVDTLKLIQPAWKTAGIELLIEAQDRVVVANRARANDYDIGVDVVSGGIDPTQNPRAYLAQHPADSRQSLPWVLWYNSGGQRGIEPSPAMKRRLLLWDQWKAAKTDAEADGLFRQILVIAADELEVLGTVSSPAQTGIRASRLHGVPDSMPGAWIWPTPNPSLPQQYFMTE
ncbi:ABC transporter substrate-binding protein [Uliginosibacterium sp. 31-16]|uniref:ABC transporter substrate-binding protein n=1 Tax=Uliginosibacterium sp. 31-16 TaxID=3068315 RepID=UPI00273E925D|nr:ABC transporter substrate-binding protein [Uliginosibacterium sp. 31-16]MDP5239901.1 ABC transporter substrate-binding protein [Uliginosibacterium sp. 31-16]